MLGWLILKIDASFYQKGLFKKLINRKCLDKCWVQFFIYVIFLRQITVTASKTGCLISTKISIFDLELDIF